MSLLAIAAFTALGAAIGRVIYGRTRKKKDEAPTAASIVAAAALPIARADGFPVDLFAAKPGDVVLRGNDEAWLAGAWVLEEGRGALARASFALFFAPEAGKDVVVALKPQPSSEVLWLDMPQTFETTPPSTLEIEEVRFERVRKRPFGVRRFGTAPEAPEEGILHEYEAAVGARLFVFVAPGRTLAWSGVALPEGMYDLLGGNGDVGDEGRAA